jgi:hypothetical protein
MQLNTNNQIKDYCSDFIYFFNNELANPPQNTCESQYSLNLTYDFSF